MRFIPTEFPGLWIIEPKVLRDERGYFQETYNQREFVRQGLGYQFVQDNHARSEQAGVLRGFHYQVPPSAQTKLVRVARGRVFDVALDMRLGSPTFGRHLAVELSADNFRQLLIPSGFAHAYLTLEPETEFLYKVDAFYDPATESGIVWSDPDIGVDWPVGAPLLSTKDRNLPRFKDVASPFRFQE